ncbi:MAG: hypothetical protein ACI30S_09370 [Muribaculaceae bacterium]
MSRPLHQPWIATSGRLGEHAVMLKTRQGAQRRRLVILSHPTSWLGESRLMVSMRRSTINLKR